MTFGPGAHLVWGPNAAGKTSLLEAIALLAWGRSHRTTADGELIRWGAEVARVEGHVGGDVIEFAVTRSGADGTGGRKRIRVNGVGRRASGLGRVLRVVLFAPEEMLLVIGAPSLRRTSLDTLAAAGSPAYADDLSTYGRTLSQRNSLLRAIREESAGRDQLRFWDATLLETGERVVEARLALLRDLAEPLAAAHREIAPDEAAAGVLACATSRTPRPRRARRSVMPSPGASPRPPTRRSGTAPPSSARIATTSPSGSADGTSRGSHPAASSARRSSRSSWPSSTT